LFCGGVVVFWLRPLFEADADPWTEALPLALMPP
jgi:hypothetical protein